MQFQKMLKMIKKNQREMDKKLSEFDGQSFDYDYKNGAVKLTIMGDLKIVKLTIDKTLVDPDDKTILEEMVAEAINVAVKDIEKKRDDLASAAMPKMPGFF